MPCGIDLCKHGMASREKAERPGTPLGDARFLAGVGKAVLLQHRRSMVRVRYHVVARVAIKLKCFQGQGQP